MASIVTSIVAESLDKVANGQIQAPVNSRVGAIELFIDVFDVVVIQGPME
jgi:hypothetical protein